MKRKRESSVLERLRVLEERLARLEAGPVRPKRRAGNAQAPDLAIVESLMARRGPKYQRGRDRGAVLYAGFLQADERRYAWIREMAAPQILDANIAKVSRVLAGLASAPRVTLLRALFGRDRSSAELTSELGDVSPGHAYHHLKELQAAGIIVQVERGVYRIAPSALIPVLVIIAASAEIADSGDSTEIEPFRNPEVVEADR